MRADTPSLIQLQVSGLCARELVSMLHDVHGCREEEGLMCWWVGQERRGRTGVQSASGNGEGELGISWRAEGRRRLPTVAGTAAVEPF